MRKRALLMVATLAGTVAIMFTGPSAAYASGPCTVQSLINQGYYLSLHNFYAYANGGTLESTDAAVRIYLNGNKKIVMFANLVADGKHDVLAKAGTTSGGSDIASSGSIGTAPSGGFCTTYTTANNVYAYLGFYIGSTYYATGNLHLY